MKVIQRILFLMSLYLFLGKEVSTYSSSIVGDILIETLSNGLIYCDSLICPQGTARCHVTKKNDPNNFSNIVRHRNCLASDGSTLQEQIVNEPNTYLSTVNINVVSGGGISSGRPLTPQEKKQLEQFLAQTQKNVADQVSETLNQVGGTINQIQSSLGNILGENFAQNLQNQISASIQNSMRFV